MKYIVLISLVSFYSQAQLQYKTKECSESKRLKVSSYKVSLKTLEGLKQQAHLKLGKKQVLNEKECVDSTGGSSYYRTVDQGSYVIKTTSYHLETKTKQKEILVKICHMSECRGVW